MQKIYFLFYSSVEHKIHAFTAATFPKWKAQSSQLVSPEYDPEEVL